MITHDTRKVCQLERLELGKMIYLHRERKAITVVADPAVDLALIEAVPGISVKGLQHSSNMRALLQRVHNGQASNALTSAASRGFSRSWGESRFFSEGPWQLEPEGRLGKNLGES